MITDLLRPRRRLLIVTALLLLLAPSLDVVPPLIVQRLVDDHLTTGARDGVLWLGVLYFGAVIGMRSVNALAIYLVAVAAQGALHDLRVRLFAHLQALPMSYYDRTPLGDIMSRATTDVETVDTLFTSGVAILVSSLLSLLTTAVAMLVLNLPLSLAVALIVPLLVAITQFFRVRVRAAERAQRVAVGLMNTHLQETLSGVEVVRAFKRTPVFIARFRGSLRQVVDTFNRSTVYNSFYPPLMATLSASSVAFLLWSGTSGSLAAWGITVGTLTAFVLLFRRFFSVIIDVGDEWQTVQSALSGLERIAQVLAEKPDDRPQTADGQPNPKSASPTRPSRARSSWATRRRRVRTARRCGTGQGARVGDILPISNLQPPKRAASLSPISLHDVTFGYLDARPVLHRLSLQVRAGEHVALVGRTGVGKSSTLHLLAGLYAPWSGMVRVAARDPRTLRADERRCLIGVVPQVVHLFSGTVLDNLTLGDASVPRAVVERAALLAGAHEFIRALPQGYDTPLSGAGRGGGAQLSAGQRQLLALARALVWDPRVVLLDEATAAVDSASDAAFRAALRADVSSHQRAVLTVAHRLATAREADHVLVMEAGRIVEEGTPDELIRRGGRFAALVELEAAGWDWQEA